MKKRRSLWREALVQVFLKPRGILKMSPVWLPLSLILTVGSRLAPGARFNASLFFLYAVLSKGLSSILINDLTDRENDQRAGKNRWITLLPLPYGIGIPAILLVSGFPALVAAGGDSLVLASFTATALLGVLYSLKPVRFKERGLWGVWAYSLSAAILHAVVPWTLFRPAWGLLPLLFSVVLAEKLVQILFHQVVDFDSDSADEVRSFAAVVGRGKAGLALRLALNVAVAADIVLLFYVLAVTRRQPGVLWLITLAALAGVCGSFLYVRIISKKYRTATALTQTLPWVYLGLSYVIFYVLPPLLLGALAWSEPKMGILAGLSVFSLLGVSVNYLFYNPKN
ncbi:MAG: UbiA family prenyltransferase [Candidatus Aminicenantes bacterium]|nr:UbiA family prenyltransferase [Candidatus Aminicenantes bacterium]